MLFSFKMGLTQWQYMELPAGKVALTSDPRSDYHLFMTKTNNMIFLGLSGDVFCNENPQVEMLFVFKDLQTSKLSLASQNISKIENGELISANLLITDPVLLFRNICEKSIKCTVTVFDECTRIKYYDFDMRRFTESYDYLNE